MPTIQSWSYSSLKQFEKCPHSQYLKRIKREPRGKPDPDSPLIRGIAIHQEAEDYVRGELPELPRNLIKLKDRFEALRELYNAGAVELEGDWGFDKDWNPCGYLDWGTVWLQSKADAVIQHGEGMATIIDYKTGKSFGNEVAHAQQGQLYGIALMCKFPEIDSIHTEFWYTDEGKIKSKNYTRKILTPIMANFIKRATIMTTETIFKPKPNKMNCKYCDYGVATGTGTCQFAVDPNL